MPSTIPSLTLQSVLRSATVRAGLTSSANRETTSFTGLTPAAQVLAASVFANISPVVVVVPNNKDVERVTNDARFFLSGLDGIAFNEVNRQVLAFPSLEVDPYRSMNPHLDVASTRARTLVSFVGGRARMVIASAAAILPRLSRPNRLLSATVELRSGGTCSPTELADRLADAGFIRTDPVETHGECCVRGGLVDIFPAGEDFPVRAEFVGDSIESLRRFVPSTQRSVETLDQVSISPLRDQFEMTSGEVDTVDRSATFFDYVSLAKGHIVVTEPSETKKLLQNASEQLFANHADAVARGETVLDPGEFGVSRDAAVAWLESAIALDQWETDLISRTGNLTPKQIHIKCQPVMEFSGRLVDWIKEVRKARDRGDAQLVVVENPNRAARIIELLAEHGFVGVQIDGASDTHSATVLLTTGVLSRGFRLPDAKLQLYAETDLFEEDKFARHRARSVARSFLSDFRDLKIGDHVVHVEHGIGAFVGLRQMAVDHSRRSESEFVELRYHGDDKLFVPVEQVDLLQKYTGATNPALDRLGGTKWQKAQSRVKKSMRDMAEELLRLYAARKALPGHAFSPDTHWQQEFESAFEYELTPDQKSALIEIKRDMEIAESMDRLLCGDVGYGKTEVALRAAFKAVMDGKQVALLTATTVLAFQHTVTIQKRFSGFPIRVSMLSRFVGRTEQKAILMDLAIGKVDVIVGTHRLLSKDVKFHDFGLLVVDEEQRFGVAHKERIKQLRQQVDVLTLTATPIPRTLNMSLAGIRDMSVIETPPRDRLAIQTNVINFDGKVISRAIRTELERGGQVYVVHNRVETIHSVAELIGRLVPEARIVVAHGQTSETVLEDVMLDFVSQKYDVLVATTIIENGLDIPNVNTIIVNHAEKFGLAQLYQLRGRVGRSDRRAYAYLVVPTDDVLTPVARQRLSAIREFSELGSGFRIAALDLEIRGAGNLLGAQQSGHIETIGFDMYVKLLEETVGELKGEETRGSPRARVNLGVDLRIDADYIAETNQRLMVYRKIASASDELSISKALEEIVDRYGPLHPSLLQLAEYARIRATGDKLGVEFIDSKGTSLVIKFRADASLEPKRLIEFVQGRPAVILTPEGVLKIELSTSNDSGLRKKLAQKRESTSSWLNDEGVEDRPGDVKNLRDDNGETAELNSGLKFLAHVSSLLKELSGTE